MSRPSRLRSFLVSGLCLAAAPLGAVELPDAVRQPLVTGCGTCHTASGSTVAPLEKLVADAVNPGFAEGSRLFEVLISRHAGTDAGRINPQTWPTGEDIAAIAAWIDALPAGPHAAAHRPSGRLTLTPDRSAYAPGDEIKITVTSALDCHLTLIAIDPRGEALVLVPNDLERETRLAAGIMRPVPGAEAGYRIKAKETGVERLVAWCTTDPRPLAGIRHAFGGHRFTLLGDWREALAEMVGLSEEIESQPREPSRRARSRRRERLPEWQSLFADHAVAAARYEVAASKD